MNITRTHLLFKSNYNSYRSELIGGRTLNKRALIDFFVEIWVDANWGWRKRFREMTVFT